MASKYKYIYTVSQKTARLRQVGINSHKAPLFSCESIELEKFSTGRVPAARVPWQPGNE